MLMIKKKYNIERAGKFDLIFYYQINIDHFIAILKEVVKIQKIQRRVREWLLKRQSYDMESASEILHSALLSDQFSKKRGSKIFDEKEAAILI